MEHYVHELQTIFGVETCENFARPADPFNGCVSSCTLDPFGDIR